MNALHRLAGIVVCLGLSVLAQDPARAKINCDALLSGATGGKDPIRNAPDLLVVLLDTSGSMTRNITKTARKTSSIYWKRFATAGLQQWLGDTLGMNAAKLARLAGNAPLLGFGLPKGGNWATEYLRNIPEEGFRNGHVFNRLDRVGRDLLNPEKKFIRNYGISSASRPMAVAKLAECHDKLRDNRTVGRLLFLMITDNDSNRTDQAPNLNEIMAVSRVPDARKRIDFLMSALDNANQHYALNTQSKVAAFPPKGKYVIDRLKIGSGAGNLSKALTATLTEVWPARPADPTAHFVLSEAAAFAYVRGGYRARVRFARFRPDDTPFDLRQVCIRLRNGSGQSFYDKCVGANKELSFEIFLDKDRPGVVDEDARPDRLEVVSYFRYMPLGLDLGLVHEARQYNQVAYGMPRILDDRTVIDWASLEDQPKGTTAQDIVDQHRAKEEREALGFALMTGAGGAIVAIMFAGTLWKRNSRRRARFDAPNLLLRVSRDQGIDWETPIASAESLLRNVVLDLNSAEERPSVLVGTVGLRNIAGPNKEGAYQEISIAEMSVSVKASGNGELQFAKRTLLIGDRPVHTDAKFRLDREWPLILDCRGLENLKDLDFDGQLMVAGEVEVIVDKSHKNLFEGKWTRNHAFEIQLTAKPATYEFDAELDLGGGDG